MTLARKSVLWAACGLAAVAIGIMVTRRVRREPAVAVGATLDDCVGQPARYARVVRPWLRLRFRRPSA